MSRKEKTYIPFDPSRGYPADSNLYYACLGCSESLPSLPNDSAVCSCGNIAIDVDYGRISIKDHGSVRLFSIDDG